MIKFQLQDTRSVYVNPKNVTHVEQNHATACTIHLVGGNKIWLDIPVAQAVQALDADR